MFDGRIIVVGWPRSGTSWSARLIINYLDGPGVEPWTHQSRGQHPQCFRVHEMSDEDIKSNLASGNKIMFVVRDPRDVATSEYFFMHGKSHPLAHSIVDTTLYDYLQAIFVTQRGGWRVYVEKWLQLASENEGIITASHEMLWVDKDKALREILCKLGIEPDTASIQHAIDASQGFTRPAYIRMQDWKKQGSTVPVGRPGEWKHHFTPEAMEFIEEYCGDLMRQLGYKNV